MFAGSSLLIGQWPAPKRATISAGAGDATAPAPDTDTRVMSIRMTAATTKSLTGIHALGTAAQGTVP
jgi:hypothetical protein